MRKVREGGRAVREFFSRKSSRRPDGRSTSSKDERELSSKCLAEEDRKGVEEVDGERDNNADVWEYNEEKDDEDEGRRGQRELCVSVW